MVNRRLVLARWASIAAGRRPAVVVTAAPPLTWCRPWQRISTKGRHGP